MSGPLSGVRALEFAGLGPVPYAAMLLADMGADVVRVDRVPPTSEAPPIEPLHRGRRSLALDLKHEAAADIVLRSVAAADIVLEGFRPGVMERLGIGPEPCLERNERLIYGRMTGWGREGPLSAAAGHDINYIALAGALEPIGRSGSAPVPPLNLLGDYGGGAMFLAFGVVCALDESRRSGRGQVVDAAMVDGAASLMTMFHGLRANGTWRDARGTNRLDTGAPFYEVYETADGRFVSIGALEPEFYAQLRELAGLEGPEWDAQHDRDRWPDMKERLASLFRQRTRAEWCDLLEGTDACFAPVLSLAEAPDHPHNVARGTFTERDGVRQASPAPRFSRTTPALGSRPVRAGADTFELLGELGFTGQQIDDLVLARTVAV